MRSEKPHPDRATDRPDCVFYNTHLTLVSQGKSVQLSNQVWKNKNAVCPPDCPDYKPVPKKDPNPWGSCVLGDVT